MAGSPGKGLGPRPHTWVTGPDELRHTQYIAWHKARAQAHFRGEEWRLTFPEYARIWGDQWHRKGRHKDSLMLMKKKWQKPWTKSNVELVDRATFHQRQVKIKAEKKILRSKDE